MKVLSAELMTDISVVVKACCVYLIHCVQTCLLSEEFHQQKNVIGTFCLCSAAEPQPASLASRLHMYLSTCSSFINTLPLVDCSPA